MNAEAVQTRNALPTQPQERLPLFALHTWLFPTVPLALQVFEPRYLNMISRQLKRERGFGVVPIRDGGEVGKAPRIYPYGVEVRLVDWNQQPNGVLGITVVGERKFRIRHSEVEPDNLLVAEVDYLPSERAAPLNDGGVRDEYCGLLDLLEQLKRHPAVKAMALPEVLDTAGLSWQLAQLLPLSVADKIALLKLDDPAERLTLLVRRVSDMSQA